MLIWGSVSFLIMISFGPRKLKSCCYGDICKLAQTNIKEATGKDDRPFKEVFWVPILLRAPVNPEPENSFEMDILLHRQPIWSNMMMATQVP